MTCAFCKSGIEDDSFYCDQCGKEIMLCESCNQPGVGGFCEADGGMLLAAKTTKGDNKTEQRSSPVLEKAEPFNPRQPPTLQLINNVLGLHLDVSPGLILGRTNGAYSSKLASHAKVSGKHAELLYDESTGWKIQDLGSTNQTAISMKNDNWGTVPKLPPYVPIPLTNNSYLLIANIEFRIVINHTNSSNSTERL